MLTRSSERIFNPSHYTGFSQSQFFFAKINEDRTASRKAQWLEKPKAYVCANKNPMRKNFSLNLFLLYFPRKKSNQTPNNSNKILYTHNTLRRIFSESC